MTSIVIISNDAKCLWSHRLALMRSWQQRGWTVAACCPPGPDFNRVQTDLAKLSIILTPIQCQHTGLNVLDDLRYGWQLWRYIRLIKPQHVFAYRLKPILYGTIAARFAGVKQIYSLFTGLGYIFTQPTLRHRLLRGLIQPILKIVIWLNQHVFVQNIDDARFLQVKHISVIPGSGIDLNVFQPVPLPTLPHFVFIGRLLKDKGWYEWLAAATRIKLYHPAIRFLVAGDFTPHPHAVPCAEVDAAVAAGIIEYYGQIEDVRIVLKEAAVCVLPSYREGLPRCLVEAMAMGRAIITTDVPGCRDVVQNLVNGLCIPPFSAKALEKAMLHFINAPEQCHEMGQAGYKMAKNNYSTQKVINSINDKIN